MKHTDLKPMLCPQCGYMMDACSSVGGEEVAPHKDDISVCFNCGELLTFTDDLRLVKANPLLLMGLDPESEEALIKIVSLIRKRGPFKNSTPQH